MADRKIAAMHQLFGVDPKGRVCGECQHLCYNEQSRRWYKCHIYGNTASASSDWAKKWLACGMIDRPAPSGRNYRAIIRVLTNDPKPLEPLEGQIDMFGGIT